jgi:RNA polymerase sigma-70 factor (ECF subfamily)
MSNWNVQVARERMRSTAASSGFRRRTALHEESPRDPLLSKAISRTKDGDPEAMRFLYVRYADNVYSYVRSIVRDEHEAEDITQSLFAKLPASLPHYQPSAPFLRWILRVARNLALDHLRATRASLCEEVRHPELPPEDGDWDRSLALHEALDALPTDQREVLILRHVVGMTPAEIAHRLDKTEASIHGLHHRGRRAMQRELGHMDAAPLVARASAA